MAYKALVLLVALGLLFVSCQVQQAHDQPSTLVASFSYDPNPARVGDTVQFLDTSTGSPTAWEWNFGDGFTSTAQNPTHTFTTTGVSTVTLVARNSSYSDSVSQSINLLPASTVIPPDRRISWEPGIPGGIPTYPVAINVKNAPYNARGDGTTDDTAAIKQAITTCPAGSAVYLPAGTYRLTSQLTIDRKSIVLRGAGPTATFLKNETTSGSVIKLTGATTSTQASVSSGYSKGSTSLVVSSVSGLKAGDYILISQANDPSVCEEMPNWAVRAIGQIVKITAISGNTLTINRPLYYTCGASFSPQINRYDVVEKAGVESLYVERLNDSNGDPDSMPSILLDIAANCWVNDVEGYNATGSHVQISRGYANEVRACYLHHGHRYTSGRAYGVYLLERCTDNLVEDNILYYLRHTVTIQWGGCGNVVGYNYSSRIFDDDYPNTDYLCQDIHTHGGHPYMNLFEGNICAHIDFDNALGSSRHNTAFRNYVERYSQGEATSVTLNLNAVEVEKNNLYENVVGNVLCRPGDTGSYDVTSSSAPGVWKLGCDQSNCSSPDPRVKSTLLRHGNYDYITRTTVWDPSIGDQNLPNSLYLTAKPAFFGTLPWPSIGSDLNPMVGDLPAKLRFEGKTIPQSLK